MTHRPILDLDYDGEGLTRATKRDLTQQERDWIHDVVRRNPTWADVSIEDIEVNGECTCGCHTVRLQRPAKPQNPRTADLPIENVGMMWVHTELGKVIGITLHANHGSLGELEVVYQENTEPWPSTWREMRREYLLSAPG